MNLQKERVALWDNIKFLMIVAVAVGHFVNNNSSTTFHGIYIFIYAFHMPVFIFLAGMFHNNRHVLRKASAYLLLYFLLKAAVYFIKLAFGKKAVFDPFHEVSDPWFMLAMCFYVLLGACLKLILEKLVKNPPEKRLSGAAAWGTLAVLTVISCAAGYFECINDFLSLAKVIHFFPFYWLGMICDGEKLRKLSVPGKRRLLGAAVLASWFALSMLLTETIYLLRPYMVSKTAYPADSHGWGFAFKLLCYGLGIVLGLAVIMITPDRNFKPFTLWGSRTLQVYFWQRVALNTLKNAKVDDWFFKSGPRKLLWIGLAVCVACLFSLKIFCFPAGMLMDLARKGIKRKKTEK